MNKQDAVKFEWLVRVREFGNTHRELFPKGSVAAKLLATITAAVNTLQQLAEAKLAATKQGMGAKKKAKRALTDAVTVVVRTAQAIGLSTPGFSDRFSLPRQKSEQALLTASRVIVREAEAVKEQFIARGLPATFVTELTKLADQFEQSSRERAAGRSEHADIRSSITVTLAAASAAVRELDVILGNQLRGDAVTLERWKRDRRVGPSRTPVASAPPDPAPDVTPPDSEADKKIA